MDYPTRNVDIILGVDCPGNDKNGDYQIKIRFGEIRKYLTFPIPELVWNQIYNLIKECEKKDQDDEEAIE